MNGSIPADATEIAHRRGDSARADAVGAARDPAESGGTASEARVSSTAPAVSSPCTVRGTATHPHRTLPPPRRRAERHRRNACDTETNPGADMQASKPRQTGTSRRERIAAAKLSELAAEARAGWDATTLERLIVKGLTRYYHGIDNEARRALAAAEPPLTGTVWDAVIAATVEHACTTHDAEVPAWTQAPERFLKRPWVYRRGPIERGTALANAPAAFIRHNTFIEPRNLDERGGERHVWADHESAAPRVVRPAEREAEAG